MRLCKNCCRPVQQRPAHSNGFAFCNLFDFQDKRVAEFTVAPRG